MNLKEAECHWGMSGDQEGGAIPALVDLKMGEFLEKLFGGETRFAG